MVKALPTEEFLVSFLVDARGGYLQAQRLPQLKIFVPPDAAPSPTRIICHLLKPERLNTLPELNDCDGFASRILQVHSSCSRFQKPILFEVPHIASLRNGEREIVIMRKNYDSQSWKEHTTSANKDSLKEIFGEFYDSLTPEDELESHRICRIVTADIPNYFCLVSRFQRDSCFIGQEGGSIESKVDSRIKIRFPPGALMKKIQISLEVQSIDPSVIAQVVGDQLQVSVSPIITVEPKRRKFRDLIEIQMPLPNGVDKTDTSNVRILFSISEFVTKWEDVTNSTELMLHDDYITHSTKISARVWLVCAPGVEDVSELANRIYTHHCCTPYIGRFLAFARRHEEEECQLRLILITDDSADKTLECQESFELIATGPDVEIINKLEYQIETAGNLVTVTKSDETIQFPVQPFLENRLTVPVRMRNHEEQFCGKVAFIPDFKSKTKQVVRPITTLDITIPNVIVDMIGSLRKPTKKTRVKNATLERIKGCQAIAKTELDLREVAEKVGGDWPSLAEELGLNIEDVNLVLNESCNDEDKAFMTLIQWQNDFGNQATGNELNRALRAIGREDVVKTCMGDITFVEDEHEAESARERLKTDHKSFHDDIWDEVMKPKENPAIYSESVDESLIAETGDDWSEINKGDDKSMSYVSDDEKSLVASHSPVNEVVDEDTGLEVPVKVERNAAPDNVDQNANKVDKTAAYMNLISDLNDAIPEPVLFDIQDDTTHGGNEADEGCSRQALLMSCMPSNIDFDLEETVTPVKASNRVNLVPIIDDRFESSKPTHSDTDLDAECPIEPNQISLSHDVFDASEHNVEEPQLEIPVNVKKNIAQDKLEESDQQVDKTTAFMDLITALDDALQEPVLLDNNDDNLHEIESEEVLECPESAFHRKDVMSCIPSSLDDDIGEDFICSVNSGISNQCEPSMDMKHDYHETKDSIETGSWVSGSTYQDLKEDSNDPQADPLDYNESDKSILMSCGPMNTDLNYINDELDLSSYDELDELVQENSHELYREKPIDPSGYEDSDDKEVKDVVMTEAEVPVCQTERHSVLHEVVESEPQKQTEVEEFTEVLPDGNILTRKIVKQTTSHTITEKTIREISPEEEEQLRAKISEEPAEVVEEFEELEDGTFVKRTITTRKTNSVVTSKSSTEQNVDPTIDEGCSFTGNSESNELANAEGPPKQAPKPKQRKNKKKSKSNQK